MRAQLVSLSLSPTLFSGKRAIKRRQKLFAKPASAIVHVGRREHSTAFSPFNGNGLSGSSASDDRL